jgi:serine/threonine protein kinase
VAVKVMQGSHPGGSAAELESFRQEVRVLSRLQHDRIICLRGACLAPPHICIVEELAEGGSLYDRLHGAKQGHVGHGRRLRYREVTTHTLYNPNFYIRS